MHSILLCNALTQKLGYQPKFDHKWLQIVAYANLLAPLASNREHTYNYTHRFVTNKPHSCLYFQLVVACHLCCHLHLLSLNFLLQQLFMLHTRWNLVLQPPISVGPSTWSGCKIHNWRLKWYQHQLLYSFLRYLWSHSMHFHPTKDEWFHIRLLHQILVKQASSQDHLHKQGNLSCVLATT